MRQSAGSGLEEATRYAFFRDLEVVQDFCSARMQLGERLFGKVQSRRSSIGLEVSPCTIAFDGIAPLGNLPLQLCFRQRHCLREVDFYAVTSGFDVANVNYACQCSGPETCDRTAASVERKIVLRAFVIPPRRHDPSVFAREVTFLRLRESALVPRVALVD